MRIIQTSDKSIGKHYLVLDDNGDPIRITTPTLIFKQIVKEDGKYFIEVYIGKKKKNNLYVYYSIYYFIHKQQNYHQKKKKKKRAREEQTNNKKTTTTTTK